jgi:hypothetical protein
MWVARLSFGNLADPSCNNQQAHVRQQGGARSDGSHSNNGLMFSRCQSTINLDA